MLVQKLVMQIKFWSKKYFGKKKLVKIKCLVLKNLERKVCLVYGQKNFGIKQIMVQKNFGPRKNCCPKKKLLSKKNFGSTIIFCLLLTDCNASACAKNWGRKDFPTMIYGFPNCNASALAKNWGWKDLRYSSYLRSLDIDIF